MEETESKENHIQEERGEEKGGDVEEEKPRWIDLFDRGSHRRCQMEYLRDKEYEEIIRTLRRGFSAEKEEEEEKGESGEENDKDGLPFHIQIPPEQYFLTPDPTMLQYGLGNQLLGFPSFTGSSMSESSFGASTITTSVPFSSRRYLPPEVMKKKKRQRRRRTAAFVCCGVMTITLLAMAIGVILHFLLETGTIGGGRNSLPTKE
ncbi:uncharacterized protein [Littorina saxatilis]|uniref:uncharacterized protein n=1 Tax=Littorina saxatilis TaxID=31220 RepID=UPI0038B4B4E9